MKEYNSRATCKLLGVFIPVAILLLQCVPLNADINLSFDFYEVGTSNSIVQPIAVGQTFDAVISAIDTVGTGVSGACVRLDFRYVPAVAGCHRRSHYFTALVV